jgi:hypothetical protein
MILPLAGALALAAAPANAQTSGREPGAPPRGIILPRTAARFDQTAAPAPQDPAVTREFWTRRRIALVSGASAAGFAGFMAIWQERDLRARKSAIEALPDGAVEEWTSQRHEAENVMKDRNFWGAAAIGLAGVTILYAISPNFYEMSFPRPGSRGPGRSVVRIRPLGLGAAATWVF